ATVRSRPSAPHLLGALPVSPRERLLRGGRPPGRAGGRARGARGRALAARRLRAGRRRAAPGRRRGLPLRDGVLADRAAGGLRAGDRKSTRLNSSHVKIPYAV